MLQLRRLPFTELKIDRTFIGDILMSRVSRSITRSIIGLAHDLGLTVTAEGVEDRDTLALLKEFGCERVQGYFVARPMSAERLALCLPNLQLSGLLDEPGARRQAV
jgi:EAL domain-containing protein (putative c-di-GMP-specific phosphodiesterase class I)